MKDFFYEIRVYRMSKERKKVKGLESKRERMKMKDFFFLQIHWLRKKTQGKEFWKKKINIPT